MKAKLVPVYFKLSRTEKYDRQLNNLKKLLADNAEFLPSTALGDPIEACDAVVFPEILGDAYRHVKEFFEIKVPILLITSEFATVSMWDWEIADYLRGKKVETILPSSIDESKLICNMLAVKRQMAQSKFLIFQDNPGEGFQPDIFKSFYWWEEECTQTIKDKFGISIERRSLKELGKKAAKKSDNDARDIWNSWDYPASKGFTERMALEAAKLYKALDDEIDSDSIVGMGTNCLNESAYCKTTPCLAWDRLLEERLMIWSCEGDIVTLTSKYMLYKSLQRSMMMTNIYPFLMGMAALKHEKIPGFPEFIDNPDDHILLAHCGNFGLLPRSFSTSWEVQEPILAIVDKNAHVFDARMKTGKVTISKLDASMSRLMSVKADLRGYIQYDKTSDCRNGGIIKVGDGKRFMNKVYSHHIILIEGDVSNELQTLGKIMDLSIDEF